jgi:hypothetical protein
MEHHGVCPTVLLSESALVVLASLNRATHEQGCKGRITGLRGLTALVTDADPPDLKSGRELLGFQRLGSYDHSPAFQAAGRDVGTVR